jgi:acetylornithine/succinyldiaminopimelate/putrescine aminotransferase
LACAASLAVFETLLHGGVLESVPGKGQFLRQKLEELQARHPSIKAIRSLGLMAGLAVGELVKTIPGACQKRHLLVLTAGEDVIRLLPPLTVTEAEIEEAVAILDSAIQEAEENKGN